MVNKYANNINKEPMQQTVFSEETLILKHDALYATDHIFFLYILYIFASILQPTFLCLIPANGVLAYTVYAVRVEVCIRACVCVCVCVCYRNIHHKNIPI